MLHQEAPESKTSQLLLATDDLESNGCRENLSSKTKGTVVALEPVMGQLLIATEVLESNGYRGKLPKKVDGLVKRGLGEVAFVRDRGISIAMLRRASWAPSMLSGDSSPRQRRPVALWRSLPRVCRVRHGGH